MSARNRLLSAGLAPYSCLLGGEEMHETETNSYEHIQLSWSKRDERKVVLSQGSFIKELLHYGCGALCEEDII